MVEALKTYLKAERGRAARLAEVLGVSESHISNMATGKKGTTPEVLRRIAEITGIDPADLIGAAPRNALHDQVAPWTPPPVPQDDTLDAYLAPAIRRRETFIARTGALWLGVLAGDLLVIDVKTAPKSGQTVLASVVDGNTAETRILRYIPPMLIDGDPTTAPIPVDQAFVMGPVVALARGPGLTEAA
jgi:transcriptional regulator with XRE-family HTH domain